MSRALALIIFVTTFIAVLAAPKAQAARVEGLIEAFVVQAHAYAGVTLEGSSTIYRLCYPTQPSPDTSHYLYDILKRSHIEKRPVLIDYTDRGYEYQTNSRKLCIDRVIYR